MAACFFMGLCYFCPVLNSANNGCRVLYMGFCGKKGCALDRICGTLCIVPAASDEIHQSYVPGRTAAVYDLAFDFSGASISAYIIWKLKQIHPKKQKK